MFEDLIMQLDEMGATYSEDYETGTLTIEIGDIDKALLVEIISALNDGMYTFNITESTITVEGGEITSTEEEEAEFDDEAYLNDALATM